MLKKRIKETLIAMKLNKEAMQTEYDEMMKYKGNLNNKRKLREDLMCISVCIAYAELLLKTDREQQPL